MAHQDRQDTTSSTYRQRLNLVDDDELRRWARLLAVKPETLQGAAKRVGCWSDDLQMELNDARFRERFAT